MMIRDYGVKMRLINMGNPHANSIMQKDTSDHRKCNEATHTQLVFDRDTVLNVQHDANWKYIKK
eukprot:11843578-Ditylum_brightwellii.AAC.1